MFIILNLNAAITENCQVTSNDESLWKGYMPKKGDTGNGMTGTNSQIS